jgi:hypothetical protein
MKITSIPFALLLSLSPSLAQAQVSIHLNIGLPVAPPLVWVEPGIQVVTGFPEEVFFHDDWYWCRRPEGWYRAHSPRERFDRIDSRRVPRALLREPIGRYRNWHEQEGQWRSYGQPDSVHEWRGPGYRNQPPSRQWETADRYRDDGHRSGGRRPFYPPPAP